jgi:hypothetical protein
MPYLVALVLVAAFTANVVFGARRNFLKLAATGSFTAALVAVRAACSGRQRPRRRPQ